VPVTHTVAATGVLTDVVDAGHGMRDPELSRRGRPTTSRGWPIRNMEVISGQAKLAGGGTVEVRVYHPPRAARLPRVATSKRGSARIEKFSHLFVPYPWPIMSVIDPPPRGSRRRRRDGVPDAGDHHGRLGVLHARRHPDPPSSSPSTRSAITGFQGMLASNEPGGSMARRGRQRVGRRPA